MASEEMKERERLLTQGNRAIIAGYFFIFLGAAFPVMSYILRRNYHSLNQSVSVCIVLMFVGTALWVYGRRQIVRAETSTLTVISILGEGNHPPPPISSALPAYSAWPDNNERYQIPMSETPPAYNTLVMQPPVVIIIDPSNDSSHGPVHVGNPHDVSPTCLPETYPAYPSAGPSHATPSRT